MKNLPRFFSGLQVTLTGSYLVVALIALLIIFSWLVWEDNTRLSRKRMIEAYTGSFLTQLEPELLAAIEQEQPDWQGIQARLQQAVNTGPVVVTSERNKEIASVTFGYLAVVDHQGDVKAVYPGNLTQGQAEPQLPSKAHNDLRQALSGHDLIGSEELDDKSVLILASLKNRQGKIVGAVLSLLDYEMKTAYWESVFWSTLGRSRIFIWGILLVGLFYGWMAARWLTHRLHELRDASEKWAEGNFSAMIRDDRNDELGQFGRALNRMAVQLNNRFEANLELAALEERNRLARDLHDTVKQQLFSANMQLSSIKLLIERDPERAQEILSDVLMLNKNAQQELTNIIHALRPSVLEGKGLIQAIREYADDWSRRMEIQVEIEIENKHHQLSMRQEDTLYRVLVEALANVARHACATHVIIKIDWVEQAVALQIIDDGIGFSHKNHDMAGLGLQSMKERLNQLKGNLQIHSLPQRGTQLIATLPFS